MNYAVPSFAVLITLFAASCLANFDSVRISTPQPAIVVLADVANYAAIIAEGALPETRALRLVQGPGELLLADISKTWLWKWQPRREDSGRSYRVTVRDSLSNVECSFDVRVNTFIKSVFLKRLESGKAYTGIRLIEHSGQRGMKSKYEFSVYLDDSLAARSFDPHFSFSADLFNDLGKEARVRVEYTAPLTDRAVVLGEYRAHLGYPPLRTGTRLQIFAGEDLPIKAALGLPPNHYVPVPSRFMLVTSDGYFEDTAFMVSYYDHPGEDEYQQFQKRRIRDSTGVLRPGYDFVLRQTDKSKEIVDKSGMPLKVILVDPGTGQKATTDVRIFPRYALPED